MLVSQVVDEVFCILIIGNIHHISFLCHNKRRARWLTFDASITGVDMLRLASFSSKDKEMRQVSAISSDCGCRRHMVSAIAGCGMCMTRILSCYYIAGCHIHSEANFIDIKNAIWRELCTTRKLLNTLNRLDKDLQKQIHQLRV